MLNLSYGLCRKSTKYYIEDYGLIYLVGTHVKNFSSMTSRIQYTTYIIIAMCIECASTLWANTHVMRKYQAGEILGYLTRMVGMIV